MKAIARKLDRIEKLFAGTGNYPCDIAEYRGVLDDDALADAYYILRRRYPALGARVIAERGECDFDLTRPADEQIAFLDGGEAALRHAVRDVRNEDQDASRLLVARRDGGGSVALCVNHALFDFPSFGFLFNELWRIYTNLIDEPGISNQAEPVLPRSPEEIIIERWLGSPPVIPEQALSVLRGRWVKRVTQRTIEFDASETGEVMAVARSMNLSVHTLVCSVILSSLRGHQDSSRKGGDVL